MLLARNVSLAVRLVFIQIRLARANQTDCCACLHESHHSIQPWNDTLWAVSRLGKTPKFPFGARLCHTLAITREFDVPGVGWLCGGGFGATDVTGG